MEILCHHEPLVGTSLRAAKTIGLGSDDPLNGENAGGCRYGNLRMIGKDDDR